MVNAVNPKKRDFLTMKEFSTQEIRQILDIAKDMKANPKKYTDSMKGKQLAMLFQKTSTRTRVSFEVAMDKLGGHAIYLDWRTTNFTLGALDDEIECLSRYVHVIMARVYDQADLETMAKAATVPVINGLSDDFHPCQALADILTIEEKLGTLKGIKLGFIGDGSNNVCNSLIIICAKLGISLTVIAPKEYSPKQHMVDWLKNEKLEQFVTITSDIKSGLNGLDILYTDTFVSMGQEEETKIRLPIFQPYQLNKEAVKLTGKDPIIMHCLPAHRGIEITSEILDSPKSVVLDEAENRMHTEEALLYFLLTK